MSDQLMLPVDYNGEELEFPMQIQQGYIQRIELLIESVPVIFEPDNDGQYRAIVAPDQLYDSKVLTVGLLQAISAQLETLFS